jgi:hypothetical protein
MHFRLILTHAFPVDGQWQKTREEIAIENPFEQRKIAKNRNRSYVMQIKVNISVR